MTRSRQSQRVGHRKASVNPVASGGAISSVYDYLNRMDRRGRVITSTETSERTDHRLSHETQAVRLGAALKKSMARIAGLIHKGDLSHAVRVMTRIAYPQAIELERHWQAIAEVAAMPPVPESAPAQARPGRTSSAPKAKLIPRWHDPSDRKPSTKHTIKGAPVRGGRTWVTRTAKPKA